MFSYKVFKAEGDCVKEKQEKIENDEHVIKLMEAMTGVMNNTFFKKSEDLEKLLHSELVSEGILTEAEKVFVLPIAMIRSRGVEHHAKYVITVLHSMKPLHFFAKRYDPISLLHKTAYSIAKCFYNKPEHLRTTELKSLNIPKALIVEIENYL